MEYEILQNDTGKGRGQMMHIKLERPITFDDNTYQYFIVSAVRVSGMPETYIFPSNEQGDVVIFSELPGSQKGTLNHNVAISDMIEHIDGDTLNW